MFEYYGIDLADRLTAIGTFTEQGELHPHGFYFDGTFDLNWFAYASEDGTQEVLICIGKNTRAGEYLNSWYQSGASKSKLMERRCTSAATRTRPKPATTLF